MMMNSNAASNRPESRAQASIGSAAMGSSGSALNIALLCGCLIAACVLAGCKTTSPSQYISPRVEGRVLDAQTHQPIVGVKVVRVVADPEPLVDQAPKGGQALERTPDVRSLKDGTFVLDSERDLELFRRTGWYSLTLTFEHAGYASITTNYTIANATNSPSGEPLVKAGDILLAPLRINNQ
jgi:hypothetical protein